MESEAEKWLLLNLLLRKKTYIAYEKLGSQQKIQNGKNGTDPILMIINAMTTKPFYRNVHFGNLKIHTAFTLMIVSLETWQGFGKKDTRWLEIGIVIYDEKYWNGGYGTEALRQWITKTFNDYPETEHIGLTTWSGNIRMMKAAEKLGMLQEARIRKVRYWQGEYYDSVKYGILRDGWNVS